MHLPAHDRQDSRDIRVTIDTEHLCCEQRIAHLKCMQNLSRAHIPKVRYMVGSDSNSGVSMRSHAASNLLLLMLKHC